MHIGGGGQVKPSPAAQHLGSTYIMANTRIIPCVVKICPAWISHVVNIDKAETVRFNKVLTARNPCYMADGGHQNELSALFLMVLHDTLELP